jgi:hypothetical protein
MEPARCGGGSGSLAMGVLAQYNTLTFLTGNHYVRAIRMSMGDRVLHTPQRG